MRRLMSFVLALTWVNFASAMDSADSTKTFSSAPSSGLSSSELPPHADYKHGYKIESKFDKFDGKTIFTLDGLWVDQDGFMNVSKYKLSPRFWFGGESLASPDSAHIEIIIDTSVQ